MKFNFSLRTLKRCCFVLLFFIPALSQAQYYKYFRPQNYLGGGIGLSYYQGDLNPYSLIQFNWPLTRPCATVFFEHEFTRRLTLHTALSYGWIAGDDHFHNDTLPTNTDFPRYIRNLRFVSAVQDAQASIMINLSPGYSDFYFDRVKIIPYASVGIGVFHFNPKAPYNPKQAVNSLQNIPAGSTWYALQPLSTEGQGLPQYPDRKPYSLIQPCIPVAFGIRLDRDGNWQFGLEVSERLTFTDYLDDVSKNYVDPVYLAQFFSGNPQSSKLSQYFSVRSGTVRNGEFSYITQPGLERGDPHQVDHYFMWTIQIIYKIGVLPYHMDHRFF